MLVILQKNVPNLGNVGDVVKVKDGYGRNFLVPRGMAVIADQSNRKRLDHQRRVADSQKAKVLGEANDLASKISANPVTIKATVGEEGKLFGSITNRDIADQLAAADIVVDRRCIELSESIKSTGAFDVSIKLGMDIEANLKVYVVEA
jgi:large subunit ribosomal protein L9